MIEILRKGFYHLLEVGLRVDGIDVGGDFIELFF